MLLTKVQCTVIFYDCRHTDDSEKQCTTVTVVTNIMTLPSISKSLPQINGRERMVRDVRIIIIRHYVYNTYCTFTREY